MVSTVDFRTAINTSDGLMSPNVVSAQPIVKAVNLGCYGHHAVKVDPKGTNHWLKRPSLPTMIKAGIGALMLLGGAFTAYAVRNTGSLSVSHASSSPSNVPSNSSTSSSTSASLLNATDSVILSIVVPLLNTSIALNTSVPTHVPSLAPTLFQAPVSVSHASSSPSNVPSNFSTSSSASLLNATDSVILSIVVPLLNTSIALNTSVPTYAPSLSPTFFQATVRTPQFTVLSDNQSERIQQCQATLSHDFEQTPAYRKEDAGGYIPPHSILGIAKTYAQLGDEAFYGTESEVPNKEKAVQRYTLAASNGVVRANNNLGVCYSNGLGVKRDDGKALDYFTVAARNGLVEAQYNLGLLLANGRHSFHNTIDNNAIEKLAVDWFELAAKHGRNAAARNSLARYYQNGRVVRKSVKKAAQLYRQAADQGNPAARNNLGCCYHDGIGVPKNKGLAVKWFKLAAAQGNEEAKNNLKNFYEIEVDS